jgi:cell fate regulator YaaT (PSP1 superfamily)
MKLIETIYQFDGNKLTFFFTAEGRIDFRTFVRELATVFKTRIELHQTSGRDEARRLGGFGMCGKQYCCGSFLKRFNQVTIKMVKDQNLAGNLTKISGPCGRLLCCLNFEEDFYVEEVKGFPLIGTFVSYQNTKMMVFRLNVIGKKIMLASEEGIIQEIDLDEFPNYPLSAYLFWNNVYEYLFFTA